MTQPSSPQPKKSIYWLILFAAVVVVGVGGWYLLTKDGKGNNNRLNTNSVVSNAINTNLASNTNSISDKSINKFTEPNNVYSINYPSDWKVPLDKGRVIYTFTPINVNDNSCYLSLSTEGLLGHGGVTFPKGKDENINISGVSVTKHVWVNESGRTMYFNIEINKGASTIGLEASTGSVSSDCSQTINEMIKTLKIQP